MQQRRNGFNISGVESLKIISQNLETIGQLQQATRFEHDDLARTAFEQLQAFDFDRRELKIGQWIDVKDTIDQWVRSAHAARG